MTDEARPGIVGPAALLLGTIVGAGVFALPAAAAAGGFAVTLAWGGLCLIMLLTLHLMFAEIVLRTGERHRLPGYVRLYLGEPASQASLAVTLLGASGALLIYLVLFEDFITALFPAVQGGIGSVVFWAVLSVLVMMGIRTVEKVELVMAALLIGIIGYLSLRVFPLIDLDNLTLAGSDALLPFGVLLFAFGGLGAVPEMHPFFKKDGERYAASVTLGIMTAALLYFVFTTTFTGAFGAGIGEDITLPVATLGQGPLLLLSVFGIAAISTSFLVIGSYLVHTLQFDIHVRKGTAPLVLLLPLLVYLLGARDFVSLVGFVGAIFTGASAFFVVWVWKRARKQTENPSFLLRIPDRVADILLLLFGMGILTVLWRSIL